MQNFIKDYLKKASENIISLDNQISNINLAVTQIVKSCKSNNKIIFCGNGGSASDAQHLAAELIGRYKKDRHPLPAISITTDTSALTAIGNDYGFENIFSRQICGLGKHGDTLVAISTSGNSKNVIKAMEEAKKIGVVVIGLTGIKNTKFSELADICIHAQSDETNYIQEAHITMGHLICGLVEKEIFSN